MKKSILFFLILFVLIEAVWQFTGSILSEDSSARGFLHGANVLLLVLGIITLVIQAKSLTNKNPHVFVRAVMGSMLIKMFVIMGALGVFLSFSKNVSKASVFAALGAYFVYLITEVYLVMSMNRRKNA